MLKGQFANLLEHFEQMIQNVNGYLRILNSLQPDIIKQLLEETLEQMYEINSQMDDRSPEKASRASQQKIQDLQTALSHQEIEIGQLKQEITQSRNKIVLLNNQLKEKENCIQNYIVEHKELVEFSRKYQEKAANENNSLKQYYLEIAQLKQMIKEQDEQLQQLANENEHLKQSENDLNLECQNFQQELEINHSKYQELEEKYQEEIEVLTKQCEEQQKQQTDVIQKQQEEFERFQELIKEIQTHTRSQGEFDNYKQVTDQELNNQKQIIQELNLTINQKNQEIITKISQIKELQRLVDSRNNDQFQILKEKNSYQLHFKQMEQKFKQQLEDYQEEFQNLKQLIEEQNEMNKQNSQKYEDQEQVIMSQKQIIEDYIEQLSNHSQEKKQLVREIEKLKIINEGIQDQVDQTNNTHLGTIESLSKELRYQKQIVKQLEVEIIQLTSTVKAQELQQQDLQEQLTQTNIISQSKDISLRDLQQEKQSLDRQIYQLEYNYKDEISNLELKINQLGEAKRRNQQQIESQNSQIKCLQAENNDLQEQLSQLNENIVQMEILEQQQQQSIQFQHEKINRLETQVKIYKQQVTYNLIQMQSFKPSSQQSFRDSFKTPEKDILDSYEQKLQMKQKEITKLQDMYQQVIEQNELLQSLTEKKSIKIESEKEPTQSEFHEVEESEVVDNIDQERLKLQTIIKNIQKKTQRR